MKALLQKLGLRPDAPTSHYPQRSLCGTDVPYPAVRRGWLHARQLKAAWDAPRIAERIGDRCWLSHWGADTSAESDPSKLRLYSLAGFWPGHGFVELMLQGANPLDDHPRGSLVVYAATPARAERLLDELYGGYRRQDIKAPPKHRIGLLNESYGDLEVRRVPIEDHQVVQRDDVALYYGDDAPAWMDRWLTRLNEGRYGLTMLSGAPGTGKTSLLRSMAHWLNETHQFYVMSAARFMKLDAGDIVSFWAEENRTSRLRKVLVLEDAESVLMRRSDDNRERVALLLNLTDGLTGDALGLQIVCTMNGELSDLDPALLRPGRLVAHREFGPLSADAAQRLAKHLKLAAPPAGQPATLAEITHPPEATLHAAANEARTTRRRRLGFSTNMTE